MKNKMKNKTLTIVAGLLIVSAITVADAQIAGNPPYTLEQSVIASGGGQNSAGGTFTLDGTIGQAAAGTTSTNNPFAVRGGFWTAAPAAPTAASVSIGGRVMVAGKRGLVNATVYLTDQSGETRSTRTSSFGYYRFDDIAAGQTVIITVVSKRYRFAPQVVNVTEDLNELNFFSEP